MLDPLVAFERNQSETPIQFTDLGACLVLQERKLAEEVYLARSFPVLSSLEHLLVFRSREAGDPAIFEAVDRGKAGGVFDDGKFSEAAARS